MRLIGIGLAWFLILIVVIRIFGSLGMGKKITEAFPNTEDVDYRRNAYIQLIAEGLTTLNILMLAFFIRSLAQ